jgi:hypothetical protein
MEAAKVMDQQPQRPQLLQFLTTDELSKTYLHVKE